jgi:hypothetical protein
MFKSWNEATKNRLRTALLWDYLFIFIYPAAIAVACFIAARFLDNRELIAFKYSLIIICLQLIAAMLDATENFGLLKVLDGPIERLWPQIARWCAIFLDLSRNASANGRIRPKKKGIVALASQTEVAQRFNGAEENSSCPIAKQLLLLLS